ncbi:MAG: VCBS repeat-containing protein, partial [Bacteroidetes bacterium]|nr:VCBS repeat-containing protein [Bacteroidota bacterium]
MSRFSINVFQSILMVSICLGQSIPPRITDFFPKQGTVGTIVTIQGNNFGSVISEVILTIGDVRSEIITLSNTEIKAKVPAGNTYANIRVTNLVTGLIGGSHTPFITTFPNGNIKGDALFAPRISFSYSGTTGGFGVSDFDSDGLIDAVTSVHTHNVISIFRNQSIDSTISYSTPHNFSTDLSPRSIKITDINSDGKPDILVTCNSSNNVNVFKNISTVGAIKFQKVQSIITNNGPKGIDAQDINGDGKVDIIVGYNFNGISIVKNTSIDTSISFAQKQDFTFSTEGGVYLQDLDRDDKHEIVIINHNLNSISVYPNLSTSSSISFGAKKDYSTSAYPNGLSFGDVNNDDKIDIVVSNYSGVTISIFKNVSTVGNVVLESKKDFHVGTNPNQLSIGDVSGDGNNDIVLSRTYADKVSILKNMNSMDTIAFDLVGELSTGANPAFTYVVDINKDGKYDILVLNGNSNNFSVMRNISITASKPTGLIAYYPFNGNANDESGLGNNGVVNGAILANDRFGKSGKAYSFNGQNTSIAVPHSEVLNITGEMTMAFWFKSINPPALNNSHTILAKRNDEFASPGIGIPYGVTINYSDSLTNQKVLLYSTKNSIWNNAQQTAKVKINDWQFCAIVVKGDTSRFYLDGSYVESRYFPSENRMTNNLPLLIGSSGKTAGSEYFNGQIDDIRIYNIPLGDSEIKDLFNYQEPVVIPISLMTNAISSHQIDIVWKMNLQEPISVYHILRTESLDSGFTLIDSVTSSVITYRDKSVLPNTNYWYKVNGINPARQIFQSNASNVRTFIADSSLNIQSIFDVPNDQGKQVYIRWATGTNFSKYVIIRRDGPMWVFMKEVPSYNQGSYSTIVHTLFDSTVSFGQRRTVFSIIGVLDNGSAAISKPDSGYSIDNLRPNSPHGIISFYRNNKIVVGWKGNVEEDVSHYKVYRSNSEIMNVSNMPHYATTSDTAFIDDNVVPNQRYYYVVVAADFSGNESGISNNSSILATDIVEDNQMVPIFYTIEQNYP